MLYVILSAVVGFCIGYFVSYRFKANESSLKDTEVILRHIREQVTSHILNDNTRLFNAIAKQKMILNEKNRSAVAIFISEAEFNFILQDIVNGDLNYISELHNSLVALNVPIGYLGELPIYVSRLLTEAPIFVVGSIKWCLD
jgi:hypothetical protein